MFGTRELSIQPEGTKRLKIQIPGLQGAQIAQVQAQISWQRRLKFHLVPTNEQEILKSAATNGGKLLL